jgi:thiamine phosphate synthase YjbQ (UPF0047 family)
MSSSPLEITLEVRPQARFDVIDVAERLREEHGDVLADYRHSLYCSYHTTAGYFDQHVSERLQHSGENVSDFINVFQNVFPRDADYKHDKMHLRDELTEAQKVNEPLNADSHLTFISSGLHNCVKYDNAANNPVYFVDLDGVSDRHQRTRKTTIAGFNREVEASKQTMRIPLDGHRIDSINLKDAQYGFFEKVNELVRASGVHYGRVEISLPPEERHSGLTVNEYETLLMKNDLAEVLHNPLRFAKEKGQNMLRNPRAVPQKAHDYAHYDLVRVASEGLAMLGFSESLLEKAVARFVAAPAARFFRLKRSISMFVTAENGVGEVAHGTYQSPILLQWQKPEGQQRELIVTVKAFE